MVVKHTRRDTRNTSPSYSSVTYLVLYFPARYIDRRRGHRRAVRQASLPEHVAAERAHPFPFDDFLPLLEHRRLHCVFQERQQCQEREGGRGCCTNIEYWQLYYFSLTVQLVSCLLVSADDPKHVEFVRIFCKVFI